MNLIYKRKHEVPFKLLERTDPVRGSYEFPSLVMVHGVAENIVRSHLQDLLAT